MNPSDVWRARRQLHFLIITHCSNQVFTYCFSVLLPRLFKLTIARYGFLPTISLMAAHRSTRIVHNESIISP